MPDVDLTGGFRLDLKTLSLFLALAGSWYTQTSKIDALKVQLDLQEKARMEVKSAEQKADDARRQQAASERQQLQDALGELKAQMKLTALDVGDLKVSAAARSKQNGG